MLVRPTCYVAALIALFAIIGCGGHPTNSGTAEGAMDEDPFGATEVTVHNSTPAAVPKVAKSDVRRTKMHPKKLNEEPLPPSVASGYGLVGERADASKPTSSKSSNKSSTRSSSTTSEPAQTKPEHPLVALIGESAPDIDVSLAEGGQLNLVRHKSSEILVVALWASYNHLCQKELPILKAAVGRYSEEQVQLIAINDGEVIDDINEYLAKNNLDLLVGMDLEQKVADAFLVRQLPFVAIIDKEGIVQGIHVGFIESLDEDISHDLEALVAGKSIIEESKKRLSRQKLSSLVPAPSLLNKRAVVKAR